MKQVALKNHYLTDEIDPIMLRGARNFLIPFLREGRILNLGLGYGIWDEYLNEIKNSEVVSLDISEELVSHFRSRFEHIQYIVSDVYQYRPTDTFDSIVAAHFLEHLDDPINFLHLIQSWLSPGGTAILLVPNAESIHRRVGKKMGLIKNFDELNERDQFVGHKTVYSMETFKATLVESGAKILRIGGTTLKPLSNSQMASLPRAYVEACAAIHTELGSHAAQLFAVIQA